MIHYRRGGQKMIPATIQPVQKLSPRLTDFLWKEPKDDRAVTKIGCRGYFNG
jgi:hypothetical protein